MSEEFIVDDLYDYIEHELYGVIQDIIHRDEIRRRLYISDDIYFFSCDISLDYTIESYGDGYYDPYTTEINAEYISIDNLKAGKCETDDNEGYELDEESCEQIAEDLESNLLARLS